jgi:nicotinamide-nucleotide amidase
MWGAAMAHPTLQAAIAGRTELREAMLRLFGIPESEIAETMRRAREGGVDLDALEITTCLRGGEVEVVTRYPPGAAPVYEAFADVVRERHADTLYSDDGRSVDEQVAALLRDGGLTIGVCESCTGGLLTGRLTELAGASDYVMGGVTVYSNDAKVALAGVDAELIAEHGAVSVEVAEALADGAIAALGADVGVGVTGVAGPGGGTEDKPVGFVCFSVARRGPGGGRLTREVRLPGARADVRARSTTVALHLVRRLLLGEGRS